MPFTHEGYNISYNAHLFNSLPHLQLTNEGLIPLHNTTFDYGRQAYLNSLGVTFALPLLLLLLVFMIYIVYIFVIGTLTKQDQLMLISATYHHYPDQSPQRRAGSTNGSPNGRITFQAQKRTPKPKRESSRGSNKCHGLYLVFGMCAIAGAAYGTFLLNYGLNRSDNVLVQFIRVATNSKQAIGNFSQRLIVPQKLNSGDYEEYYESPEALLQESHSSPSVPPPKSAFQRWFPNTYSYLEHYATYTNSSSENIRYFEMRFRHSNYAATTLNVTALLLCTSYWVLFLGVSLHRIDVKYFILLNITLLLLLTLLFNLTLTFSIALSDFCLTAKPVIADVSVYKIPSNNLTTRLVNYYLYCDLNRLNLDQHKNTVLGFLDRVSTGFNGMLSNSSSGLLNGLVSGVKSGIESTYDTLHCMELNRLINEGLSEFCTTPIDGLAIGAAAHLFSLFLFVIALFMITFSV